MAKGKKNKDPLGIGSMAKELAKASVVRQNAKSAAELNAKKPVLVQSMVVEAVRDDVISAAKVDTKGWSPEAKRTLKAVFAAQARLLESAAPTS